MISMARPFLADPDLLLKARTGRTNEINTCIGCNQACLDHVFVGQVASCLVNPMACHETELQPRLLPLEQRLRIGVVGAGPAGCAFTLAARQMGHDVVLYDKDSKVGGQFHMAKRIPGKEEFHETLRFFETMLHQPPSADADTDGNPADHTAAPRGAVELRLNTTLSAADMEQDTSIDIWIDATGVEPRDPKIPGQDHPNVLSYIDVLKHKKPVGKRVAIIGAGGIGFDVAEYLLHHDDQNNNNNNSDEIKAEDVTPDSFWKTWGIDTTLQTRGGLVVVNDNDPLQQSHAPKPPPQRQLYMLQRKTSKLGKGLGKTTGWIHRATLKQSGAVEMIAGAQYQQIDANGHLHITTTTTTDKKNKKASTTTTTSSPPRILEVDTIVLCSGQVEHTTLRDEASPALKRRLYAIGGAYHAGELDAKRAIDMGTRLALQLHNLTTHDAQQFVHPGPPPPGVEQSLFHLLRRFL
ncbi:hypothetical protein ACA910_008728 [Epithemia clementina (nom. ined.)]